MPRIDRYVLAQLLAVFGFFALVLVSVYWLNRAVLLFEKLIGDGQTALVVLEFTALTLPVVIALVLPAAAFAASAWQTHRLAAESELAAMQAAGLSPFRMARPVLVFGVLVGLMVAVLVNSLVPMARSRLAARQAEIAETLTTSFLRPGVFQHPVPGVTLFIRQIGHDGAMRDLLLEDARNPARPALYTADGAQLVRGAAGGPQLVMTSGLVQERAEGRLAVTRFGDLTYDLASLTGANAAARPDLRNAGTLELLRADPALLAATGGTAPEARLRAHQRLAQPLLAPVAAMLGFSMLLLGGFSRFGVGRQVMGAVVGLIVLQFLNTAAESRAAADPALWPVLYVPALLGAAGVVLVLWLAGRPRRRRPA